MNRQEFIETLQHMSIGDLIGMLTNDQKDSITHLAKNSESEQGKYISYEALKMLLHILEARIDNAENRNERCIWYTVLYMIQYVIANDMEALRQYDYLTTNKESWFLTGNTHTSD